MSYFLFFTMSVLAAASSEPAIVDQAPNYGGPTSTVFYLTGSVIVVGAVVLWALYQLRKRRNRK